MDHQPTTKQDYEKHVAMCKEVLAEQIQHIKEAEHGTKKTELIKKAMHECQDHIAILRQAFLDEDPSLHEGTKIGRKHASNELVRQPSNYKFKYAD